MKVKEKNQALWLQTGALLLMAVFSLILYSWAQATQPQVDAGYDFTLGLKTDGTVVAVGRWGEGQLHVGSWTHIVQVAAGDAHTVGLKSDGTVVAVGDNQADQLNVSSWSGITRIAAGYWHTVGLKADGRVVAVGEFYNMSAWTNIIQVAASYHTVGLKSDGTVVAVGGNMYGQLNVGSWTNIVQVAAGRLHSVGLKSDGTVLATGLNDSGELNVGSWTNIIQVAADSYHTVGLKADGRVVAVGDNQSGQLNVGSWTNIVQVATDAGHTVGLKSDGRVVCVGDVEKEDDDPCNNTDKWDLGSTGLDTLTMFKAGFGTGSVTSDPPGIDCGSDCSERYQEGAVVTLTASADAGFVFREWSGGGCSGTGVCVVTMNANTTVTATFTLPTELSPTEGTIGTQITITGSDFGTKKGKVFIGGVATKIATDGWADDRIVSLITKVPPPGRPYDVTTNLQPYKTTFPMILPDVFTVKNPELDPLLVSNGSPGTAITITGNFFSTKRGKVYLEYNDKNGQPKKKNCKVTSWTMDSITFVVPKGLVFGVAYPLKVTNTVGIAGAPSDFTIDL